ncbi:MAG: hypothetical protein U5M50_03965 [Sphingobium sp.]|nr:hypothetical protein [Sphingobium sp.]
MSQREIFFAAVETALGATGAVEVERMASSDPASFPALHIVDDGQSIGETEAGSTRYQIAFSIEGYVEGTGGSAMHSAINSLHAEAVTATMALIGAVDGLENIEEGDCRIAVAPLASQRRLAFAQDFVATVVTRRGHP